MIDRAHRARGIIQGKRKHHGIGIVKAVAILRHWHHHGSRNITALASSRQSQYRGRRITRQTHHTVDASHGRRITRLSHHTADASHGRRIIAAVPFSQETCVSARSVLRVCAESDESARSERHRCHARIPHTEGRRVDHQHSKARGKASVFAPLP